MKYSFIQIKVLLFGLTILSLSSCNNETSTNLGKFTEVQCPFDLPEGLIQGKNFNFGYVTVPEFHNEKNGKTLKIAVAVFPSTNPNPQSDPIILNTSGPGKSNMDNFIPDLAGRLGKILLAERDVVIIELRGLRYSEPFLQCTAVQNTKIELFDKKLSADENKVQILEALKADKQRFEQKGVNLSAFNNKETAADIAMIMRGLGYDKINLIGSSAGTLIAHHVIRDYPEMVRCAILDAGLPIDSTIMKDYVPSFVNSLKNYFDECKNDSLCSNSYPDLENRFLHFIDSLNANPVELNIQNPETKQELKYLLTGYRLSSQIALGMFYTTQIPLIIHKILEGDYSFVEQSISYSLLPSYFADGLGFTIFITESGYYSSEDIIFDPKYKTFADGVSNLNLGGEFLLDVQEIWQLEKLDTKELTYNKSYNVPVVVFNGLYDPVIPVKYDRVMKKNLENCYIYRFDGVPHSAFDNATDCVLPAMLEFLNNPQNEPNVECLDNFKQEYR